MTANVLSLCVYLWVSIGLSPGRLFQCGLLAILLAPGNRFEHVRNGLFDTVTGHTITRAIRHIRVAAAFMAKTLVVCCDGTNNQFDGYHTNVIRAYKVARRHPGQLTYYDPGVGTMPEPWRKTKLAKRLSMLAGLIYGDGFFDNISDAYRFLIANYEPGDKIFLFGFSRGAYAARAVAALLRSIGLLHPASDNLLPYAQRYWQRDFGAQSPGGKVCAEFKTTLARTCPVHFIGVWDTVSSVGVINNFRTFPHTLHNPEVTHVRHAVSIDERRSTFRQNLMLPATPTQDVKNVWFAGVHSDVGGGYPPEESALAKLAFEWMIREAKECGLDVDDAAYNQELRGVGAPPDPCGMLHVSLRGGWWLGELLPMKHYSWDDKKWHWRWLIGAFNQPRDIQRNAGKPFVSIHHSVIQRLNQMNDYRPVNIPNDEETLRGMFRIED